MNKDEVLQSMRYLMIALGGVIAGRSSSGIATENVVPLVDAAMTVIGAGISLGTAAWGLYVKWKTKAVPIEVAARRDVPTVDTLTGKVEAPSAFTG